MLLPFTDSVESEVPNVTNEKQPESSSSLSLIPEYHSGTVSNEVGIFFQYIFPRSGKVFITHLTHR